MNKKTSYFIFMLFSSLFEIIRIKIEKIIVFFLFIKKLSLENSDMVKCQKRQKSIFKNHKIIIFICI